MRIYLEVQYSYAAHHHDTRSYWFFYLQVLYVRGRCTCTYLLALILSINNTIGLQVQYYCTCSQDPTNCRPPGTG